MLKTKLIYSIFLALLISTITPALNINLAFSQETPIVYDPIVYVDPPSITGLSPSQTFTINVIIANVTNFYGIDLQFAWNPTILEYVSHTKKIPVEDHPDGVLHSPGIPIKDEVDPVAGTYWVAYASMDPAPAFDGTGIAFNMTFKVIKNGGCALEFTTHDLSNESGNIIEHEKRDGYFESSGTPVARFNWQPTIGVVDEPVTFNASESFDPDGTVVKYYWDFDDGNNVLTSNPMIYHTFNHTSPKNDYYVSLIVEDNTGINSSKTTADPPLTIVQFRNVGITGISLSTYSCQINTTIYVNVTIKNYGVVQESFNLTAYYNISSTEWTLVNTTTDYSNPQNMSILPSYEVPYSFAWNTTGLPYTEVHYVVQVNVTGVPYDDETDSTITSNPGWITEHEIHDLSVETLSFRASHGGQEFSPPIILGEAAKITIEIRNLGTVSEKTFNVTLYGNGTVLNHWIIEEALLSGRVKTLAWIWREPTERGYYNMTAEVTIIYIDNETQNNVRQGFLRVIETPELHIIYTPTEPVVNETVTLNASTSIHKEPGGQIIAYAWELYSPDQIVNVDTARAYLKGVNVSYMFTQEGNWTIVLKVTDNYGFTYDRRRTLTSDYRVDLEYLPIKAAEEGGGGIPIEYIAIIVVVIIIIAAALVILYRRRQQPAAAV
jgi:hypothetical protein